MFLLSQQVGAFGWWCQVWTSPPLCWDGERISSTHCRTCWRKVQPGALRCAPQKLKGHIRNLAVDSYIAKGGYSFHLGPWPLEKASVSKPKGRQLWGTGERPWAVVIFSIMLFSYFISVVEKQCIPLPTHWSLECLNSLLRLEFLLQSLLLFFISIVLQEIKLWLFGELQILLIGGRSLALSNPNYRMWVSGSGELD